jgi:diaminopimelate decarboxylase
MADCTTTCSVGQFRPDHPQELSVLIANRIGASPTESASVVGPLCTPLDLLADRMELAVADVDDLVAVFQSGAYGFTASPLGFLSHPAAVEVLV